MSEPNDPNAKYEPVAYPRMLYATPTNTLTVYDEREEEHARQAGYTDFDKIDPERDGLEFLSIEALIDIAVTMIRTKLVKTEPKEIIEGIRDMRVREAEEAAGLAAKAEPGLDDDLETGAATGAATDAEVNNAAPAAPDDFDQMDKPALRAFIKDRDGKNAPGFFDEDKLRHLARNPPATT